MPRFFRLLALFCAALQLEIILHVSGEGTPLSPLHVSAAEGRPGMTIMNSGLLAISESDLHISSFWTDEHGDAADGVHTIHGESGTSSSLQTSDHCTSDKGIREKLLAASWDPSLVQENIEEVWDSAPIFGSWRSPRQLANEQQIPDRLTLCNRMQRLQNLSSLSLQSSTNIQSDLTSPSIATILSEVQIGCTRSGLATRTFCSARSPKFSANQEAWQLRADRTGPQRKGLPVVIVEDILAAASDVAQDIKPELYKSNQQSAILLCIDFVSHLSIRRRTDGSQAYEGQLVECISKYNHKNRLHQELRATLGESNFQKLARRSDAQRFVVAASIVAVNSMRRCTTALSRRMDERVLLHCTASVALEVASPTSGLELAAHSLRRKGTGAGQSVRAFTQMMFCARGTTCTGHMRWQGFGAEADKFRVESTSPAVRGGYLIAPAFCVEYAGQEEIHLQTYSVRPAPV